MKKLGTIITIALFLLCGTGSPAFADGRLVSAKPAAGARVNKAPEAVRLTFDKPVLGGGANVVNVTGPDGKPWSAGTMGIDENVVTALLSPLGPKGEYVVDYVVRLGDPVPLTGQFRFTLTEPGPAAPQPAASKAWTWQGWAWLGGILVLVAVIIIRAGMLQARARR